MANTKHHSIVGQTESLAHLAPFVEVSRQKIRKQVEKELEFLKELLSEDDFKKKLEEIVEMRVREEIKSGVQTIVYQINTLMTTNGLTRKVWPF